MKELSIEEKAKRYDEALEKARQLCTYPTSKPFISDLQDLFPELKESEDERTWIINYLSNRKLNSSIIAEKENLKKAIAWLEKQSEPDIKEPNSEDERIRKAIINVFASHKDYENFYGASVEDILAWLEKQGKNNMGISEATKKELEDNLNKALEKETPESWNKFLDGGEQNPTWSEEELDSITAAINNLEYLKNNYVYHQMGLEPAITFLKSLKDRVLPQPKQEWSEQEQVRINRIVALLENMNVADNDILLKDVDWLKSLRLRNTWKPSESDIIILEQVIDGTVNPINYQATLHAILEQLKKLREE